MMNNSGLCGSGPGTAHHKLDQHEQKDGSEPHHEGSKLEPDDSNIGLYGSGPGTAHHKLDHHEQKVEQVHLSDHV
ncbi:hypothetical protein F2Q70_00022193 [Brassica cretica]|uniref:Uncharacterized protein n=1 Tax=Brassica cretica TaxID=69181 RepID=A0A8S9GPJ9_BRACR|nr:hypothetical protein F2Q70_00022193 [Brassica cretica]